MDLAPAQISGFISCPSPSQWLSSRHTGFLLTLYNTKLHPTAQLCVSRSLSWNVFCPPLAPPPLVSYSAFRPSLTITSSERPPLTYTGALFTTCTAAHLIRAPDIPQSWIAATASEKRIPRCCLASYHLSSAQPDGLFKTGPHVSHGSQSSNGSSSHFEQNLHSSNQTFQGLASAHLPASFLPDLLLIKN